MESMYDIPTDVLERNREREHSMAAMDLCIKKAEFYKKLYKKHKGKKNLFSKVIYKFAYYKNRSLVTAGIKEAFEELSKCVDDIKTLETIMNEES